MKLLVIGLTVAALLIIVSLTPVLIGPTIAVRFAHWLGGAKVAGMGFVPWQRHMMSAPMNLPVPRECDFHTFARSQSSSP